MLQKSIMDTKPELKWLSLEELYIPVKYQRALEGSNSLRNIDFIQKNFNWAEFGTLLVSKLKKDNAKYAIIDGQHRFRGAELRDDIDSVPCVIISPRGINEQAQTFININSRRIALSSLQHHRAALIAGDETSVEIDRICKEANVSIPSYPIMRHMAPPDTFQSIGSMRKLVQSEAFNADNIIWALKTLQDAYPKKNGILSFNMVKAMNFWAEKYPDSNKNDAIKVLRSVDIDNLDLEARKLRVSGNRTIWRSYFTILEREYITLKKAA